MLIAALGSGHPLNIDGIGGGNAVTTKVAILSQSPDPEVDIDYLFAQVSVLDPLSIINPHVAICSPLLGLLPSKWA